MKLFIGCASSNEIPDFYFKDCNNILNELLKDNDLIYGAYNNGIMKTAYDIAKKNNRNTIGVTPKEYKDDIYDMDIDEKIVVENIDERTHKLIDMADAIIFLPGGIGTINEMFSAIDSKRCGELNKPIIIYNSNHYYDHLFVFLDKLYNEKFSPIDVKNTYFVVDNIEDLLNILNKKEV